MKTILSIINKCQCSLPPSCWLYSSVPTSSVGVQAGGGETPGQLLGSGPGPGRRPRHTHQAGHQHQHHPASPGGGAGGGAAYIGRLVTLRLRGLKCPLDVTLLVCGRLGTACAGWAGGYPGKPSKVPSNPSDSRPNLVPGSLVTTWNINLKLSLGDWGVKCPRVLGGVTWAAAVMVLVPASLGSWSQPRGPHRHRRSPPH